MGPVLVVVCCSALVAVLALAFPPIHHHYAGGDAADYLNNAFQRSYGHRSGERFTPPDWPELDAQLVGRAFTDGRYLQSGADGRQGLMTNYVRVFGDEIHIPHDDLTALVMAAGLDVGLGPRVVAHLNYALLLGASLAMVVLCRALGFSMLVSAGAGVALVLIPSQVMGARYPLSEALAQALWLGMVAAVTTTRGRSAAAFLPLPLLVLARPEFAVVAAFVALWAGFGRRFAPVLVLVLAASALAAPSLAHLGGFAGPYAVPVAGATGYVARRLLDRLGEERGPAGWRALAPWRCGDVLPTVVVVATGSGIVAAELIRRRLGPGESFGPIRHQRYSTLGLLLDAVGWPLLLLGVMGLTLQASRLARKVPAVVLLMVVPQLAVFASMQASPTSVHFWTRRFHVVVFPVLVVGAAAAVSALARRAEPWARRGALACGVLALIATALPLRHMDRDAWRWSYLNRFHGDVAALPAEAVVLLPRNSPGLKAQLPMRTVHGLYSFVVFDAAAARQVLTAVGGVGRPVLVDAGLAQELGLSVAAGGPSVQVQVSAQEGSTLELRPWCAPRATATGCD